MVVNFYPPLPRVIWERFLGRVSFWKAGTGYKKSWTGETTQGSRDKVDNHGNGKNISDSCWVLPWNVSWTSYKVLTVCSVFGLCWGIIWGNFISFIVGSRTHWFSTFFKKKSYQFQIVNEFGSYVIFSNKIYQMLVNAIQPPAHNKEIRYLEKVGDETP